MNRFNSLSNMSIRFIKVEGLVIGFISSLGSFEVHWQI